MRPALHLALIALLAGTSSCGGDDPNDPGPQTATVAVTPEEVTLSLGESRQLTAVPQDANGNPLGGRSISWSTSAQSVATVSVSGMVHAVGTGVATVTATADGKAGHAEITVAAPPVASITVVPHSSTLLLGTTDQWTADVRDAAGNAIVGLPIAWSTTAASIARVSATGLVNAISEGGATITATADGKTASAPVSVITVDFTSVATGGAHTCALTSAGAAYCWGRNENGQLGVPIPPATCPTDAGNVPCIDSPTPVGGGLSFEQLAAGGAHTCGLTADGTAYCWGDNSSGQLGDNTRVRRTAPVAVTTDLKFASLDLGSTHTCGLTAGGSAYCWGDNVKGQLGDGSTIGRTVPGAVTGEHTFTQITAGAFAIGFTCGLTTDGSGYCWGNNDTGQLGIGFPDVTDHPSPTPVTQNIVFAGLSAGLGGHSCGWTATGSAYCWGQNTFGALGYGENPSSPNPVAVAGGHEFIQVSAGGFIGHTCGIVSGGAAYCWGENERGQVGDGSTTDRHEPVAVFGGLSFDAIDTGFRHSCGLTTGGVVYCWGSGATGQLGLDSGNSSSEPEKVLGQP